MTTEVDHAEQEGDHRPYPTPDIAVEEAGRHKDIPMNSDELTPGHSLFALRSGRDAVAFENISHRLITNLVTQVF